MKAKARKSCPNCSRLQAKLNAQQAELDAQWEKRPAFSATTLPVSSFALKGIEAEELKNQKLRENFKVEYSTATPFPNNPERR